MLNEVIVFVAASIDLHIIQSFNSNKCKYVNNYAQFYRLVGDALKYLLLHGVRTKL